MKKGFTIFHRDEEKLSPVNRQSALIVRRASELQLHTPPIEPPRKEPTLAERLEFESKIRRARIAKLDAEHGEAIERGEAANATHNKELRQKPKVWKNMWAAKNAKRLAKSRGLPPPTTEELRAVRAAQPGYGQALSFTRPRRPVPASV